MTIEFNTVLYETNRNSALITSKRYEIKILKWLGVFSFERYPPSLADLRRDARDASPGSSFWENFDQILGWHPHLGGWRPLLWKILDPPLSMNSAVIFNYSPLSFTEFDCIKARISGGCCVVVTLPGRQWRATTTKYQSSYDHNNR